jgi:hypothetical protein
MARLMTLLSTPTTNSASMVDRAEVVDQHGHAQAVTAVENTIQQRRLDRA